MSAALFLIKRHEVTAKQGEGKMIGRFLLNKKREGQAEIQYAFFTS